MPEEIVADYDIRSPASRTLLTVIGTLVAVGLFAGAVLGVSILMKDTKTSTSIIELGESAQIVVNATTADIQVVEGADDVVKVTSRVTSGLRKTDFLIGRKGDEIKVISGCTTWLSPGCGVSLTLSVPKGIPVVINTTSGDVDASFAAQPFAFKALTKSGDISASIPSGDRTYAVTAESRSGEVESSIDSDEDGQGFIRATSNDGDITLSTG